VFGLDLIPHWRRDAARLRGPLRPLAHELDEYDRSDHTRTRLLAWTVAAWAASVSLFRPVEAAFFGIALFIAIYRFPASLRVVLAALRAPAVFLVVLYLLVTAIATMASTEPYAWRDLLPKRLFLAPLLVLLVLPRWRMVLAGLAAGAFLQAAYALLALVLDWIVGGERPPIPLEIANGSSTTMVAGVVVAAAWALHRRGWWSVLGGASAALVLAMQAMSTMRAAVVGSLAGVFLLLACTSRRTRWMLAGLIGTGGILAGVFLASPAARRIDGDLYASLNHFSSNRLEMWRLTLDAVADKPVLGHGRNEWRAEIDRARDGAVPGPEGSELIWTDRRVGYSHNTPLDVLYEAGVIGLIALGGVLVLVARSLRVEWGSDPLVPVLAALLVSALALAQFDFILQRAIPGTLLLISLTLSAGPAISRRTPA
jgi:O-antigen ligase